ncbi:MAG: hypothetical protein OEL83_15180 [Desulforhopalus sp.]|nr:hypothetical protein [Desulforhopalus sp.]
MNPQQYEDLLVELSRYGTAQIRKIVDEYRKGPRRSDCQYPFYEFLKEKLERGGGTKKKRHA